jgi:hypothetical protein
VKYIYDPNNKELNRYVLSTMLFGEPVIFKRYGTDPERVKRELIVFIHEMYNVFVDNVEIKEDPTHPMAYNENTTK